MADEVATKIAEAKEKMFKNLQPSGGKIVVLFKGDVRIKASDANVEVRKMQ